MAQLANSRRDLYEEPRWHAVKILTQLLSTMDVNLILQMQSRILKLRISLPGSESELSICNSLRYVCHSIWNSLLEIHTMNDLHNELQRMNETIQWDHLETINSRSTNDPDDWTRSFNQLSGDSKCFSNWQCVYLPVRLMSWFERLMSLGTAYVPLTQANELTVSEQTP